MLVARRVGALLLAVAAVVVWFVLKPAEKPTSSADFSSEIAEAMANYELNNSAADSAPQQAVVNGWVAKDLLEVVAREQNAALSPKSAPRDERVPAELLLVVLGVALLAATTPKSHAEPQPRAALAPQPETGPRPGAPLGTDPGPAPSPA